jgi:hypothetical protein
MVLKVETAVKALPVVPVVAAVYDRRRSDRYDIAGGHRPPLQPKNVAMPEFYAEYIANYPHKSF